MKNESGKKGYSETIGEKLPDDTLDNITGGSTLGDYWEKLVSECQTPEDAFNTLVQDTKAGKVSVGIADVLVGDIEPYYKKKGK